MTKDVHEKNATLLLAFNRIYDIAGRTGTPFSVFSRRLDVEALKGGLTLVLERDTIGSFVVDGVFEDGDPSKPAGMFRCSRRGPRSRTLPRSRS